jgi:hypothetical protein
MGRAQASPADSASRNEDLVKESVGKPASLVMLRQWRQGPASKKGWSTFQRL